MALAQSPTLAAVLAPPAPPQHPPTDLDVDDALKYRRRVKRQRLACGHSIAQPSDVAETEIYLQALISERAGQPAWFGPAVAAAVGPAVAGVEARLHNIEARRRNTVLAEPVSANNPVAVLHKVLPGHPAGPVPPGIGPVPVHGFAVNTPCPSPPFPATIGQLEAADFAAISWFFNDPRLAPNAGTLLLREFICM
eukprot:TRINITY_DN4151_c0_g1_i2.p1 TRINITY_DN4151_c0_g1~~TRINITY_DN4151_c0_g1_i2.p1  ORF type:complete len:195 (-),score=26.50 TRINITY_DN4151_c0_g1_i2:108-692(-)